MAARTVLNTVIISHSRLPTGHTERDKIMKNRIFSTNSAKAIKAQSYGFLNAIHYLAPASLSGFNLCVKSSAGCRALCLGWFSGQASMVASEAVKDRNSSRLSRIAKAKRFMRDRAAYMRDVVRSIELEQLRAAKLGMRLCVRLNGSSDIGWEGIKCERMIRNTGAIIVDMVEQEHKTARAVAFRNVMEAFPDIDFVDYTKIVSRFDRELPRNYWLTLSRSESNEAECIAALGRGINVAVVFAGDKPQWWNGYRVIDGDLHDLRQLDPRNAACGTVIGLSPKGRNAKRDTSGFVVRS